MCFGIVEVVNVLEVVFLVIHCVPFFFDSFFKFSGLDKVVQVVFGGFGWSQLIELDGTLFMVFWLD